MLSSPSSSPTRRIINTSPQRTSPFRRQHQLVKSLSLTRSRQRWQQNTSGRKRPFPTVVQSASSPRKMKQSDDGVGCDAVNTPAVDERELWEEASKILPLLSYGEESNDLLSALLNLPAMGGAGIDASEAGGGGSYKCEECSGEIILHTTERREQILSELGNALEHMLRMRNVLRYRVGVAVDKVNNPTKSSSPPTKKRQRFDPVQKARSKSSAGDSIPSQRAAVDVLPWNVMLRIAIRMSACAAKQLQRHTSSSVDQCKCTRGVESESTATGSGRIDGRDDEDAKSDSRKSVMHPMLQVFDIALSELHVLSRLQQDRHCQDIKNESGACSTKMEALSPGNRGERSVATRVIPPRGESQDGLSSLLQLQSPKKAQLLPKDRLLYDWKSRNKVHDDIGREVWGPSRYAFLRDVESITNLFMGGGEEDILLGVNADEWHEKVNSLVVALDECVRVELAGNNSSSSSSPHHERNHQPTLGMSPSLMRYGASPSRPTSSLAEIARAHVERLGSRTKAMDEEFILERSELPPASNEAGAYTGSNTCVNLQSLMDTESNNFPLVEGDTDELEDAYRMAIAFGSSNNGGENKLVRETMERRLYLLVKMVSTSTAENRGINSDNILNIDGAQSYLESLLRALIKPSDPKVWLKLMNGSRGNETPMILRRGRTLLVSYLVGVRAPGWKACVHALESSPVPYYLGYLSPREDFQSSRAKGKEEEVMKRSSYFLPAVDIGETTLPPSPVVTEMGLSLCVKKFLHRDTPDGSQTYQPSGKTSGIALFRNYGPLQYPNGASNESDRLLDSLTAPLPDANELTRDLFDLVLRLAVVDDNEHENKPFPLRLTVPSPSESLSILLQVVSDHLEWLSTHAVSVRYRFVLERIIQSFQCFGDGKPVENMSNDESVKNMSNDVEDSDQGFTSWSQRASYLIDIAETTNRGRMALYATQFMMLLCSTKKRNNTRLVFQLAEQTSFYTCLQLRQPSQFWTEIDKTAANSFSSNIMTRVLDKDFCVEFLLPLSYQCALLLAGTYKSTLQNDSTRSQLALSIVTILTSVFDLLSGSGFLKDCIHVGWAIQMLQFSISNFVHGEDYDWQGRSTQTLLSSSVSAGRDSMWENVECQLHRLYRDNWGNKMQMFNQRQSQLPDAAANYICYQSKIQTDAGVVSGVMAMIPSFDVFAASLVKFACSIHSYAEFGGVKRFCQFIAKKGFDCYLQALQSPPCPENGSNSDSSQAEFSLLSSWIGCVVSNLQAMVSYQKARKEEAEKRGKTDDEASTTEEILTDLITPMLRCLHLRIMRRGMHSRATKQNVNESSNGSTSSGLIISIFVDLHKQEVDKFLTKPSPSKTRRWGVYRKCLEEIFDLTPPSLLFMCPGSSPALTEHSVVVLEDVWNQFGQCDLSYCIHIMVAAGLHVNTSLVGQGSSSLQLKQLCDSFSSCAKDCIINAFKCFGSLETKHSREDFNHLVRSVRKELSFQGEAEVGLAWWNKVKADISSQLDKSKGQDVEHEKSNKSVIGRDIAKAFSTLQNNLSAISHSS